MPVPQPSVRPRDSSRLPGPVHNTTQIRHSLTVAREARVAADTRMTTTTDEMATTKVLDSPMDKIIPALTTTWATEEALQAQIEDIHRSREGMVRLDLVGEELTLQEVGVGRPWVLEGVATVEDRVVHRLVGIQGCYHRIGIQPPTQPVSV